MCMCVLTVLCSCTVQTDNRHHSSLTQPIIRFAEDAFLHDQIRGTIDAAYFTYVFAEKWDKSCIKIVPVHELRCTSSHVVECQTWNHEVTGSNPARGCCVPSPTQTATPPGSANKCQWEESFSVRPHCKNARRDRCQEYHNCFLFGELEETTRTSSNYMDEDYPVRPGV